MRIVFAVVVEGGQGLLGGQAQGVADDHYAHLEEGLGLLVALQHLQLLEVDLALGGLLLLGLLLE